MTSAAKVADRSQEDVHGAQKVEQPLFICTHRREDWETVWSGGCGGDFSVSSGKGWDAIGERRVSSRSNRCGPYLVMPYVHEMMNVGRMVATAPSLEKQCGSMGPETRVNTAAHPVLLHPRESCEVRSLGLTAVYGRV